MKHGHIYVMCTRSLFIKDKIPPSPSWSKASDFDSDTPRFESLRGCQLINIKCDKYQMIYYKPIELDYYDIIVGKCLAYVKTIDTAYNRMLPRASWYDLDLRALIRECPELILAFKKYDLRPIMAAIFIMYDRAHTSIHVDVFPSQTRINLPLLNCKNTYTNFYESKNEPIKWINPDSGVISFNVVGDYKLVDRVELTQATVIRTKALHSVDLPIGNPVPRITLTLGFDKDPVYLLDT